MRWLRAIAALALAGGFGLLLAACGSSSSESTSTTNAALSTSGLKSPLTEKLTCAKKGGTLDVLQENDFEHLDPGISYYSVDYSVVFATQRPLYSNKPNSIALPATPDVAEGQPEITEGGKEVTVHIKHGIRFSPPVNSEVTSEDVAYAIERGANPNVANPYFHAYFEAVEGAPSANGGPISGITTPNKYTIVFKLTEPDGQIVADALVLPLSAPVPKSYAEKFDKNKPSNYVDYEVATGPYMLKNNAEGKVLGIGYTPGKEAVLVRNPNWSASTDYRPACLNEVVIKIGGTGTVLAEETLKGTNVVDSEGTPAPTLKLAYEKYKSQLEISPGAGMHYIGVNNAVGPFRNEDLRKAFYAALNRKAMNKLSGGELVTTTATHFIYPTIPGFEQAGGVAGPKVDFNEHAEGDMAVATEYIKKAGYPSGKYTGGTTVSIVAASGPPAKERAELVNETLKNLGFKTKLSLEETATMYAKYCNVPKEEITICPSVGWIADFGDAQTVLNITFNGKYINSTGNVNWSQANNATINKHMNEAVKVVGAEARAKAWGATDREVVEHALAVPVDWDKMAWLEGTEVEGVGQLWNTGQWDYSFTSLK
ncbi:MAG TPA: ABC transporter substrate-binding protein [Solirubrobacteraceae bacterium]|nr:ABC transporter substrate-binding protein [Solirubrobacteraceae bacterium]